MLVILLAMIDVDDVKQMECIVSPVAALADVDHEGLGLCGESDNQSCLSAAKKERFLAVRNDLAAMVGVDVRTEVIFNDRWWGSGDWLRVDFHTAVW